MTNPFQIIDINRWWRTGGTNYPKLLENSKHVIIQACAGRVVNELLDEQVSGVLAEGRRVETYGIPDNGDDWADFYLDLPHVQDHPKYIDWEISGGVQAYPSKVTKARDKVNARSPGQVGLYTNYNSATRVGQLPWIHDPDLDLWWAEYPYVFFGGRWQKYDTFDRFFINKPDWSGKWSARLGVEPIMIQFTDKGRAQLYGANPTTDHPKYTKGIQSADLNAGLIPYADYIERRFGPYETTPPPVDPPTDYVLATLADHEMRIRVLEDKTDTPSPPTPPDPHPELAGSPYQVRSDKLVAFEKSGTNTSGAPKFEINAFQKYGDPQLKWNKGDHLRLYRPAVVADGGVKYLKCADTPRPYGDLYVKQSDVMKLD